MAQLRAPRRSRNVPFARLTRYDARRVAEALECIQCARSTHRHPPLAPPELGQNCRLCGELRRPKGEPTPPTPLRPKASYLRRFWLVMRSTGRRPKKRHTSLEEAQEEARRIAAQYPAGSPVEVWVIECSTVETITAPLAAPT